MTGALEAGPKLAQHHPSSPLAAVELAIAQLVAGCVHKLHCDVLPAVEALWQAGTCFCGHLTTQGVGDRYGLHIANCMLYIGFDGGVLSSLFSPLPRLCDGIEHWAGGALTFVKRELHMPHGEFWVLLYCISAKGG